MLPVLRSLELDESAECGHELRMISALVQKQSQWHIKYVLVMVFLLVRSYGFGQSLRLLGQRG